MSVIDEVQDVPTVYIRIAHSAVAFESSGEILETVTYDSDGRPDWSEAGICDYRGVAGKEGYDHLRMALTAAEANARQAGYEVLRVPVPS